MTTPTLEQEILDALAEAGVPRDCYQLQRAIEARRREENRPTRFLFWNMGYEASLAAIQRELDRMRSIYMIYRESDVPLGVPPRFWYRLPHKD